MAERYMGLLLLLTAYEVGFIYGKKILSTTTKAPSIYDEESLYTDTPLTTLTPLITSFRVKTCPKINIQKNVDKNRLLGVWFAYATTPLDTLRYKRRCTSYNVANTSFFKTNILFTDYNEIVITYACKYNNKTKLNEIKLRVLTHTRSPDHDTTNRALDFLESIAFPIDKLLFLESVGFCFEWYILRYHQKPRPGRFNAPINVVWDHRRR